MPELILTETSLTGFEYIENAGLWSAVVDAVPSLVADQKYKVVWDNKEYISTSFVYEGDVGIGNQSLYDSTAQNTGEPFVAQIVVSYGKSMIATTDEGESHTIAIYEYVEEETPAGASIVLYDRNGNPVTYEGIETVTFNTPVEGETVTFTHGTAVEDVPVELDLSKGDQTIKAGTGELIKSAVIKKPDTLTPENVRKGVSIGGVDGELIGEGVSKTVDLDFSEGDQTVTPDEDTLLSEVVIKKPEGLVSENIAKDVDICGVIGEANMCSFDSSDEHLKYFGYHFDLDKGVVELRSLNYDKIFADTGSYDVVIPDTLGGYPVLINLEW